MVVQDLVLPRKDAEARHIIQATGSSSLRKEKALCCKVHSKDIAYHRRQLRRSVFRSRSGRVVHWHPHAFHKKNCLDAIAAGKNVLCDKAFTPNARDAKEVIMAAKVKSGSLMEAMWTRFTPLMQMLRKKLHEEKVIGDVRRTFCDFCLDPDITSLSSESRYRDPTLGAGSLLGSTP